MEFKVQRIQLSNENQSDMDFNPATGNTDVIVTLNSGKKFITSFYSYGNIEVLAEKHQENGEFLEGEYFWDKNMVLVKDCERKTIELVVNDIIDEGNFPLAFRPL
ncbi:MAG: hypothetical protein JXA03_15995 [Bacteroidales bacterium]|nr:hypothetical protein [Bacteroidales bacterium]